MGEKELNYRLGSAAGAWKQNKQLLMNQKIWLSSRVAYLNAYVRSCMVYGCQNWRPTAAELNRLDVTYRRYLRNITPLGHTRRKDLPQEAEESEEDEVNEDENGDDVVDDVDMGLVLSNDRLLKKVGQCNISDFFAQQQQNWVSHIIRQPNNELVKMLLFESERNSRTGRINSILPNVVRRQQQEKSKFIKDCFMKNNSKVK